MRIAVLGTGTVGQTIAGRLDELGHNVVVGTRDPRAAVARTDPGPTGGRPFGTWAERHPNVGVGTYADAASEAELVVNATNGAASIAALEQAGEEHLAGKVLVDVANPLDFSTGTLRLFVANDDSLAERIQRRFPDAKVVKTLNTVNAAIMVRPDRLVDGDHSMFVCGDDADAKAEVTTLLASFGWRDVIDLGDLTGARGMEMYLPLWVRLAGVVGRPDFSIRVVR